MIAFIDEYRDRFSVEFICQTLKNHREGGFITSRGYRDAKKRAPSARQVRDRELVELVGQIHAENYGVYGVRKMWRALKRQGVDIGREQTRRIMKLAAVAGKRKGKNPVTTVKSKDIDTRPDLVQREFTASAPNRLWVADITYVRTTAGFVYAAFVIDAFSRKIVGWALSDSMKTEALPLQAVKQAIWNARSTTGLVHHSDHGSQYVSLTYHQHLVDAGIVESTGSVGDSYDNALAENVNGSYKNEIIHTRRWADVLEVEIATFEWVHWWNTKRLHQALNYRTPHEVETEYWQQREKTATIENRVNT
ncbi:transposase InsO family protein [Trueperella bonasi]|uniref:Transposase InsO family protein n=2 Tax=Trueperella bonasi TaxID=312286 RepID=A0ABT9NGP5_9ACTO|nr:transposase InsO family protein [Trueperella bonasi]MDP9806381.1 transposase InsO family protein [Trueperella bonasi]MDP9807144.1 transposase InsO family protein [Trueperella bonasi]